MEKYICHDCEKQLNEGDEYVSYLVGNEGYLKCKECFEKDPILKNFQPCDVYSRVVGFHTPIRRWNDAKFEEWKDRKTYKI